MDWPENNEPACFNNLCGPARKAIEFAYEVTRQNEGQDIPWDGLPLGREERSSNIEIREKLTASFLERDYEDQGRDALDIILGSVIQTGIEQGRRMERAKSATSISSLKRTIERMKRELEDLLEIELKSLG